MQSPENLPYGRQTDPTAFMLSKMVLLLNDPGEMGLVPAYNDIVSAETDGVLGEENSTNRGAELLFKIVGDTYRWTGDTDLDGLREACDHFGNPLILLSPAIERDIIIEKNGTKMEVSLPPYYGRGVYINSVALNSWFKEENEEYEAIKEAG
jgi:hypothetical protein